MMYKIILILCLDLGLLLLLFFSYVTHMLNDISFFPLVNYIYELSKMVQSSCLLD